MTQEEDDLKREKAAVLNQLLDDEYVLAHIDPSVPGVILPAHLKEGKSVTLRLSRLFRGGIEIANDRIVTDLLFGDQYFSCVVPLTALWGVTTDAGHNMFWTEGAQSVIAEALQQHLASKEATKSGSKAPSKQRANSHLRRVK